MSSQPESPSSFLRIRLPPPVIDLRTASIPSRNTGFTKISSGQVFNAGHLSIPTRWSIEPALHTTLVDAVESDLDNLLLSHADLVASLKLVTDELHRQWGRQFGAAATADHARGLQSSTTAGSRILLQDFSIDAFKAISLALTGGATPMLWSPTSAATQARCFIMDHIIRAGNTVILGAEDKRLSVLPHAAEELFMRGMSSGVVEVEVAAPEDQPNWWLMANKGALYAAAYDTDWVVFAGLTVYCIGYRLGPHVLWSSPIYNRRDRGNEVSPGSDLAVVFGDVPPPTAPQTCLPLLFLAMVLKAELDKGLCLWIKTAFPSLSKVSFDIPSGEPTLDTFARYGRDPNVHHESSSGSDNDHGTDDDCVGSSSGSSGSDDVTTRASAPTPLVSGLHRFTGKWAGELSRPAGYRVEIGQRLSEGLHGIVYSGKLVQNHREVAQVAVKMSDAIADLQDEFSRYQDLGGLMRSSIPRCRGICVASGTAFLVTDRVFGHFPGRDLTKAERGAVYAILLKMHQCGWAHNDVVDHTNKALHNLLWTSEGRPVIIDLVTATPHACGKHCKELKVLREILHLSKHDVAIWARA
ncbi:hypothetical protein B0H15DRAFT_945983 [Mycena belliarum]|uniref:Protein kinase domain-containing protein n=1 Tax=Mycena belliarum TaxID=1033014 RepID=A0AAD6XVS3_9AGAR|nr:hypothetical protein B0H15DRAFT_945983 [Mycena belliae]